MVILNMYIDSELNQAILGLLYTITETLYSTELLYF